jgi:hypothetical protein
MAITISSASMFAGLIWMESKHGRRISANLPKDYLTMPIAKIGQSRVLSCPVGANSNQGTFCFSPNRFPMDESRKLKGRFSGQDASVTIRYGCPYKCTLFEV